MSTYMDKAREASQTPLARFRRAFANANETPQDRGEYKIPMPRFKFLEKRDDDE